MVERRVDSVFMNKTSVCGGDRAGSYRRVAGHAQMTRANWLTGLSECCLHDAHTCVSELLAMGAGLLPRLVKAAESMGLAGVVYRVRQELGEYRLAEFLT